MNNNNNNKLVDDYILNSPTKYQCMLSQVREIILACNSEIHESISYCMPCYKLHGKPLVYFALNKHHLGFYPTSSGVAFFNTLNQNFRYSKGCIQFPLKDAIPFDIIKEVTLFRVRQVLEISRR